MNASADYFLDQLRGLEGLRSRAMFGGTGLYRDGVFFAIIFRGRLYFRAAPATAGDFTSRGMRPFTPPRAPGKKRQTLSSYYEVPEEVIEDPAEAVRWARRAAAEAAALAAGRKRAVNSPRRPRPS